MKRTELNTTGKSYRLTPAGWGQTNIMVDEEAAALAMEKCFGCPCDPDSDPNDLPETVEIMRHSNGEFFAILEPFTRHGKTYNENMYRPCDDPSEASDGLVGIHGGGWLIFEDEE